MSKITNLIGTTWRLGGDISQLSAAYGIFNVLANGTYSIYEDGVIVEGQTSTVSSETFYCGYSYNTKVAVDGMAYMVLVNVPSEQSELPIGLFPGANIDFVYEFTITGGTDISNHLFIDFINTYGTLVSGGEPPTAEGVKSKLQSLITASNAKTGKSDANLTDAVKTLLEGFGSGEGIFAEQENEHGTTVVLGADLQEKTIDITENGTVEVTPDDGYALKKVTAKVDVKGVDKIQKYIELNGNSAEYLFQNFKGDSVDELMEGVDTSNVTSVGYMFYSCANLVSYPVFDTRNVTSFKSTFYGCLKLTNCPPIDTSNATDLAGMFNRCLVLTTTPKINAAKVANQGLTNIITQCLKLEEFWIYNIRANLSANITTLKEENLLHICKECWNTGSAKTLTLGTTNLAKIEGVYVKLIDITDEMRAEDGYIDNKSPFVQCESTDEGAMTIQDYMATKMWSLA